MNDNLEENVETATYAGCCLFIALLCAAVAVGLGYIAIAGLGAIVRLF